MEENYLPNAHKKRYAKATIYLEVPEDLDDEYKVESEIERLLDYGQLYFTGPADVMVSECGSDEPEKFIAPVGYIAPDGKFYLMESSECGLAHIELAPLMLKLYGEELDNILLYSSGVSIDYGLERAGFVKVHQFDIRYLAHFQAGFGDNERYTPDITDAQLESILRYCKLWNYDGCVDVNGKRVKVSAIKQADKLALRKIFSL
jgi:hypothetical protein